MHTSEIEYTIIQILESHGSCTLDRLVDIIPDCSWNQIFTAIDTMSRDGRLRLQHPDRCGIQVSLRSSTYRALRRAV